MTKKGSKRHICSFALKNDKGEVKPNVVVIVAPNSIIARAKLCEQYGVPNKTIQRNSKEAGVRSVRLAETNIYEGESESDNFGNDT